MNPKSVTITNINMSSSLPLYIRKLIKLRCDSLFWLSYVFFEWKGRKGKSERDTKGFISHILEGTKLVLSQQHIIDSVFRGYLHQWIHENISLSTSDRIQCAHLLLRHQIKTCDIRGTNQPSIPRKSCASSFDSRYRGRCTKKWHVAVAPHLLSFCALRSAGRLRRW